VKSVPDVSVVMSVYNADATLESTLLSILNQQNRSFEFIVVNDGSSDRSAAILDDFAEKYSQLQVIHQQNTGLTRALILGCAMAQGAFIARQDAGDISLPGRLAQQLAFMQAHPEAVMTACGVEFRGPRDEVLYDLTRPSSQLDAGLHATTMEQLRGPPHHGATMFRRDAYLAVGGYRLPFVVAQDLDLWLRLAEVGRCLGMNEVMYAARHELGSISSQRRGDQFKLARLALAARAARLAGSDDAQVLATRHFEYAGKAPPGRAERARFHYFVGTCLRRRSPRLARDYFARALRDNPFHFKALAHWMMSR